MAKYIIQMVDAYTREVIEVEDEVFDDWEEAKLYASQCESDFAEGAEVLELAGRSFTPGEDVEFVVEEISD